MPNNFFCTMITSLLQSLERATLERDPLLAEKLKPGLSKNSIRRRFERAKVVGQIECLIELYSWKDGISPDFNTVSDSVFTMSTRSLLPKNTCYFINMKRSIVDYQALEEVSKVFPFIEEAVGRYYPILWNGDVCWLAVDLQDGDNRVILLNWHEKGVPFPAIYGSIEDLIVDLTHVQEKNIVLRSIRNWQL